MRNFIIFFDGKEGTSPIVRLLNNFSQISIIHQVRNSGWEPFDRHNCGSMSIKNLKHCLEIIFNKESIDLKRLNHIYCKSSILPLEKISKDGVVGFKMRYNNFRENPLPIKAFPLWNRLLRGMLKIFFSQPYKKMMLELLKRNNIIVFFAVRQDLLRWGLSKYHGDGQFKAGHLQFDLASGKISKEQIERFHVNCSQLEKIILKCKNLHNQKRKLIETFLLENIQVYPLCYENFLADKYNYFNQIFEILELEISKDEIDTAIKRGAYFKKVHSDDISDFVVNHQEVIEKFGNSFISWC